MERGSYHALFQGVCIQLSSDTITASLSPLPSASITVSGSDTICLGDLTSLTVSGVGNILWSTGEMCFYILGIVKKLTEKRI